MACSTFALQQRLSRHKFTREECQRGDRATGVQELDDQSRTLRFILHFDPQNIRLARDRWTRLLLYTTSYADLLDQTTV